MPICFYILSTLICPFEMVVCLECVGLAYGHFVELVLHLNCNFI